MNTKQLTPDYLQECRVALSSEQARSLAETDNWSHVDKQQVHLDWDALYQELVPMIQRLPPSAPEIQSIMARHYDIVSRFYRPSKQAYIGMSLFYGENQDMRNFHTTYHPNMVEFLAEAMPIYAHEHLLSPRTHG
jgi:predicted choloylglycine hydrolase